MFGYHSPDPFRGMPEDRVRQEARRLNEELEDARRREDEEREKRDREDEKERRERAEARENDLREVHGWADAFNKGRVLCAREAAEERRDNARYASDPTWKRETYFQDWGKMIDRAAALHAEEQAKAAEEIKAIRARVLGRVADKLAAEFEGHAEFIQAIRDDKPDYLVDW